MKFTYRPEIDGLRAISIIGVVLFHFEFPYVSGGYLGVDVFIVISGFLITAFIFNRLKINEFSFSQFLYRRAKRLLPSFFLVLFLSLIFAYFIFLPDNLINFSRSLISSTFLSSNFFFWLNSGYWDESNSNPLLHTWSLSLEWQFYFLFSLFCLFLWKLEKSKLSRVTIILFILLFFSSLFVAIIFKERNSSFFLLPFRLYEFFIGSFVYFIIHKRFSFVEKNKNILSFFAILFVLLSFIIFDSQSNIPGYISLIPCLSTGLLIYISGSKMHNFLKNRILVYLGLISYSLYLYHWPIWIFLSWINIVEISFFIKLILIVLSVFLSILNYHFIENPMRKNFQIKNYKKLILISIFIIIVLAPFQLMSEKGYPDRFTKKKKDLIEALKKNNALTRDKFLSENTDSKFSKDAGFKVLVLGDSNGEDMFFALKQNVDQSLIDVEYLSFSAWCFEKPVLVKILGIFERIKNRSKLCNEENIVFKKKLELLNDANFIVLSSSWNKHIHKYIEDVISYIKSHTNGEIIISSKSTHFPDISTLVKRIDEKNISKLNQIAYKTKLKFVSDINYKLKKKANVLNLKFMDKSKWICSDIEKKCNIYDEKNNEFNIIDNHHWTLKGAKTYGKKIKLDNFFNNF
tara:strand:- start:959 stop:2851 length:1893 start_codon:yes stop_codon:yes gene_type:complete